MSDDVQITQGGIIAVDPDDLRVLAGRLRTNAVGVQLAREQLLAVPGAVGQTGFGRVASVWSIVNRLDESSDALTSLASTVGEMADVYELAELRAQQAMLRSTDPQQAKDHQHRIDALVRENPRLAEVEQSLHEQWRREVVEGFTPTGASPWWSDGPAMAATYLSLPAVFALVSVGRYAHWGMVSTAENAMRETAAVHGVVRPGPLVARPGTAVVEGSAAAVPLQPGDVRVRADDRAPAPLPAGAGTSGSAPRSLSEAVARIPANQRPQVRVEKYVLADGSCRFAAYIDGTRSNGADGRDSEPWDMASNAEAYLEHAESDAYKATVAALRDAGADSSTPVDLVGYSQGGLISDLVAQSGEFDVRGVFTVGSPIEPMLPDDVLDVAVRHTDDVVAGLAGGGSLGGTGSADSLVISRTVAPGHGIDPAIPAHVLSGYQETVRLAEESGDPRLAAITAHFAALQGASMTSTDYTATRVPPP